MRTLVLTAALLAATPALAAEAAPAPAAQTAPDPAAATKRTEELIAAFKAVKSGADAKTNAAAYAKLDGFFDFDTITTGPISNRLDKFTPAQRKEFDRLFEKLVRENAYPSSGDFFREAQLEIAGGRAKGDVTVVTIEALDPADDMETEVGVHWKEVGGALKVVDVDFDGDSLIVDYRNQFTGIIDREGVDALLTRAKDRLAELQKPKAADAKE